MLTVILRRDIVALYPQVFFPYSVPFNDISNDIKNKDGVMLCIIANVTVVPEFGPFYDGTV